MTLAKLTQRFEDAKRTSEFVRERMKGNHSFDDIVREVERKIPYELNSRKPLSELISAIQPDQRRWELVDGNQARGRIVWDPQRNLIQCYLRELKSLKAALQAGVELKRL
jgi:hypothetical protein